jgi:hypothetical protein
MFGGGHLNSYPILTGLKVQVMMLYWRDYKHVRQFHLHHPTRSVVYP